MLPRMRVISSKEKARNVSERTWPREQTLKDNAVALSSSGASQTATTSWLPSVQKRSLTVTALPRHFLESLRAPDRFLDVADALIGEACEHDECGHDILHHGPRPTGSEFYYEFALLSSDVERVRCRKRKKLNRK